MGVILKLSDQQGCHIWYYRVARSSVDTQTSPPAVIPRVTERRSACFQLKEQEIFFWFQSESVRNSNITGCTKPSLYEFLSPPACFDVSNFVDQAVSHQARTITLYHRHISRVFHFPTTADRIMRTL